MNSEGHYITIEGIEYPLPEEIFDLIQIISLERDAYLDFIEGKLEKKDLLFMYPDLKLKTIQLNFKEN